MTTHQPRVLAVPRTTQKEQHYHHIAAVPSAQHTHSHPSTNVSAVLPSSSPSPTNGSSPQMLRCLWRLPSPCTCLFADANDLYIHVTLDHIGRRTTNNLSLLCAWDDCSLPEFGKRDHATSHVRIHIPLKPYVCGICRRAFKRPQDRKKHDKLHENEAIREGLLAKGETLDALRVPQAMDAIRRDSRRRSSNVMPRAPPSDASSDYNATPSPLTSFAWTSPSPAPLMSNDNFFPQGQASSYDSLSDATNGYASDVSIANNEIDQFLASSPPTAPAQRMGSNLYPQPALIPSSKRTYDPVDDFMMDIKRKKFTSTYDPVLAERLDEIALYLFDEPVEKQPKHVAGSVFAPAFDSQPVEDLNELNDFLLQLSNEIDHSAYYLDLPSDDQQTRQQPGMGMGMGLGGMGTNAPSFKPDQSFYLPSNNNVLQQPFVPSQTHLVSPIPSTTSYPLSPDVQQHMNNNPLSASTSALFFPPQPMQDDYIGVFPPAAYGSPGGGGPHHHHWEREQQVSSTPYVPTVYSLLPQQAGAPVAPAPPTTMAGHGRTPSRASQDAETEAMLKQFRDMNVRKQLDEDVSSSTRPRRQQAATMNRASALMLRNRHSVLVKTLMQRVADKISKHK
ncbi:hypothetical protein HKX48_004681 [Thoreauomyces humboldtii]|nr:hypothetical protein HKX48_004681 [Thoreauomyces humboldtii]